MKHWPRMSALGQKQTFGKVGLMSALPPCVDGSELARRIFTSQAGSVQPCVRPLGAVHMTAGHNALRGSGPGQKPAFDDAVAQVGCPDRRIDGSALRAVRPPNLHITPDVSFTPQARRVLCSARLWPSSPR